ncbi:putative salicylate hydroxylase [Aspergillus affinis]|uniref:putative salicylate hydroxylase n=1 Tax=Aspergillus affinis TaxID=1070780 RepID=UPI0022FF384E|nr:FAD/NAD(P)-binding domain-containing protein [Aspergillus affinis]KAI9037629.1 FAD/NAD(P)-binding domain-containing protein [Aspergillus affinis]
MGLQVIVVGAGLAGLAAAIALHRAGHDVKVIEQSGFHNEVGAAIHVAPNATRVLKDLGCDFNSLHPVQCNRLQVWSPNAELLWTPVVTEDLQKSLGTTDEWVLTHRVDLHNTLREAAAQTDAEAGTITLENGTVYTGDLIVGADGIHSRAVKAIVGETQGKESTGQNCFRFLVPVAKAQANPLTAALLAKTGLDGVHAITAPDRRLVVYPCRSGELLNIVAIHPAETEEPKEASWLESGNLDHLVETYSSFGPECQELCRMAEDLKLWSLASRTPPQTFFKGKLALVGDAAHPTLPHQGQGGAQAFEDGAALGGVFPADTTPDQVPQRLALYNQVRYDRAVTVMMMSKTHDERRAEMLAELREYVPNAELPANMFSFTWPSRPAEDARRLLAEQTV